MSTFPAVEMPLCRALNRWGAQSFVHWFFAGVSRLGDGAVWYALMLALPLADGWRGAIVSAELAATGLVSLAIYRLLKRWIRRPRPYTSHQGIIARVPRSISSASRPAILSMPSHSRRSPAPGIRHSR